MNRIILKFRITLLLPLVLALFAVACQSGNTQDPSESVQNYLQGLVAKDAAKLISYSCKTWEKEAQKELDSFMNVGISLENVDCDVNSKSSAVALVSCRGYIKLTYDTEIQKIDLSKRAYQLILENNEWMVCGLK
jgi:hypothetical protein